MDFFSSLHRAERLGGHDHEQTWRVTVGGESFVAKLQRMPAESNEKRADSARLIHCDGVAPWLHFHWLSDRQVEHLSLPAGKWLAALRSHIRGKTVRDLESVEEWQDLALKIAYRVRDLHDLGYVHGDIKPGNIVVDEHECVWLIDTPMFPGALNEHPTVLGSAPLMAPELWEGGLPTMSSDVYALGTLVARLASVGPPRYPLAADDLGAWMQEHCGGHPELPPQMPSAIRGVVQRMLSKRAEERPNIQSLIDALSEGRVSTIPGAIVCAPRNHRELAARMAEEMASSSASRVMRVEGSDRERVHQLMGWTARLLELSGHPVLHLDGVKVRSGPGLMFEKNDHPWAPVPAILEAAWRLGGVGDRPVLPSFHGDTIYVHETLEQSLSERLNNKRLVLIWEDFDGASPDVVGWFLHLVDTFCATADRLSPRRNLRFALITDARSVSSFAQARLLFLFS